MQKEPKRAGGEGLAVDACVRTPAAGCELLAPVPLVKRAAGLEPLRGTVESSLPTRKHQGSRMPE